MNDNFIVFYIVFGIIAIILSILIMRWIFGIDRHLKNQRATIALLIKLCRQQGVSDDDIDGIKNTFEIR